MDTFVEFFAPQWSPGFILLLFIFLMFANGPFMIFLWGVFYVWIMSIYGHNALMFFYMNRWTLVYIFGSYVFIGVFYLVFYWWFYLPKILKFEITKDSDSHELATEVIRRNSDHMIHVAVRWPYYLIKMISWDMLSAIFTFAWEQISQIIYHITVRQIEMIKSNIE